MKPSDLFDLNAYDHTELFSEVTSVWEALKKIKSYLNAYKLGNIATKLPSSCFIEHPELISIGAGTIVEPGVFILGPCILGKNCHIRHGAYIRGGLIAGDDCVIGHTTEVKNSILLNGVRADHFAYIGDSILGNQAHLGAGVKLANLKLDSSLIIVNIDGNKYETGLNKLGSILGDNSQIGCNAVLNPGTIIGKGSFCFPSLNFGGYLPAEHVAKPPMKPNIQPKN